MRLSQFVSLKGLTQDGLSKDDIKWIVPLFAIIVVGSGLVFIT